MTAPKPLKPRLHADAIDYAGTRGRINRTVYRLIRAETAYSWMNGGGPDNIPAIKAERREAWRKYRILVEALVKARTA